MPLSHDALAAHRHLVYGYALRLLGDADDAADVTQDVLVRAWRRGGEVEADRLRGWILRVTRNACLDHFRARSTRPNSSNGSEQDRRCPDELPDALAETSDFRRHLESALAGLDDPYRSIVILREIEGLPYRDIADAVDLPLNTVKVYLHRGRRQLRERLRSFVPTDDLAP